jgi:Fur family ferric uptake transcriptional regulator
MTDPKRTADDRFSRFKEHLRLQRLKSTTQRDTIVRAFLETQRHVSVEELYTEVRKRNPRIGYATVYRTMKLLEEAGIAHTRRFGNTKETLYELAAGRSHHDHLICERCGRIVEFVNPEVERIQDRIASRYGFTLSRHRHELYGVCPDCQSQGSKHETCPPGQPGAPQ